MVLAPTFKPKKSQKMNSREIKAELRSNDETGDCALRLLFPEAESALRDLEIWLLVHSIHRVRDTGKIMATLKAHLTVEGSDLFRDIEIPIFSFPKQDEFGSYEEICAALSGDRGRYLKKETEIKLLNGTNLSRVLDLVGQVLQPLVKLAQ